LSKSLAQEQLQFEVWIEGHHSALYKHALWMTGRSDVANDCVQETYFQAWKDRKALKDKEKVLPWLLTILRRTVYRVYSQRTNESMFVPEQFVDIVDPREMKDHESLLDLISAMRGLSEMHREVILLYGLHGLSYTEISRVLEIPAGTVMSRISRARSALDSALNSEPGYSDENGVISFIAKGRNSNE